MKKIRFTEDVEHETFGINHPDNPKFSANQVETMRNDLAERWLKRSKAELVEDLGPDEIPGADPEQVAEVRQVVEQRVSGEIDTLAESISGAAQRLKDAVGQAS